MTNPHEQLHCATTVGEALDQVATALESADLYYGHGTDNPWDEAVQLVLAVAGLPADSDNSALPHPVTREQAVRMAGLLRRRIERSGSWTCAAVAVVSGSPVPGTCRGPG